MHFILKNHVNELADEYELTSYQEPKLFEFFCNFCVVSKHYLGRFNPVDVTTAEDDASLDGIAIVIDGELITKIDDAIEIFETHRPNLAVDLIFTQAKSGENFKKSDISNFSQGLQDFLSLEPKFPNGKFNLECLEILKTIFSSPNLRKVKNRRPNIHVYYSTSGTYRAEAEISASFDILKSAVTDMGYFHSVSVNPMGRTELLNLYAHLTQTNEASLKVIDYFGMPKMPGIPQSYVAIVNASCLVDSLLTDKDGNLMPSVFEENVRSFLGSDNDVNSKIKETLSSESKRSLFSVLNNGITIVAPDLTLIPNTKEINLSNYQIINGCQTSNTLFENKDVLTDDVNVVVKFIESPDNEVSNDVISATNSQSNISQESFLGLKDKAKLIQKYFLAKNQSVSPENRIYFERRESEYRNEEYPAIRTFDVREMARCYAAMFLGIPHTSSRYVKAIFSKSGDKIFREDDHESYYYCACLTLYKYQSLINARRIGAKSYNTRRWHVIHVFKWVCHNKVSMDAPNSNKAEKYAQKIIDVLNSDDRAYVSMFEKAQEILDSAGSPTNDELKREKFTRTLMEQAKKILTQPK